MATASKGTTAGGRGKGSGGRKKKESRAGITVEQRQRMVRTAAYYRAEQRGFNGGDPLEDWLAAEAEVDAQLAEGERGRIS